MHERKVRSRPVHTATTTVLEVRLSDTASGLGVFAKSTIEADDTTALMEYEGEIYENATAFPAGASTEYVMEHKGDGTLIDSSGQQHEDKTARYINHAPAKSTASMTVRSYI